MLPWQRRRSSKFPRGVQAGSGISTKGQRCADRRLPAAIWHITTKVVYASVGHQALSATIPTAATYVDLSAGVVALASLRTSGACCRCRRPRSGQLGHPDRVREHRQRRRPRRAATPVRRGVPARRRPRHDRRVRPGNHRRNVRRHLAVAHLDAGTRRWPNWADTHCGRAASKPGGLIGPPGPPGPPVAADDGRRLHNVFTSDRVQACT